MGSKGDGAHQGWRQPWTGQGPILQGGLRCRLTGRLAPKCMVPVWEWLGVRPPICCHDETCASVSCESSVPGERKEGGGGSRSVAGLTPRNAHRGNAGGRSVFGDGAGSPHQAAPRFHAAARWSPPLLSSLLTRGPSSLTLHFRLLQVPCRFVSCFPLPLSPPSP